MRIERAALAAVVLIVSASRPAGGAEGLTPWQNARIRTVLRWMEHYLKGPGGAPPPTEVEYEEPK